MAILDIFKKKKKAEKPEAKKTPKAPKEKGPETARQDLGEPLQKPAKEPVKNGKKIEKKQFSEAYRILRSPHVTEKSGMLADRNSYVFKVASRANKPEIKGAVQDLYGVSVKRVTIINIPKKARRLKGVKGFKSGFKKAMVKLAEGEKIEIMPR